MVEWVISGEGVKRDNLLKLNAVGGGLVGANSVWRAQIPESKKPAIKLVSLNMVPGLGIEPRTRGFSIPAFKSYKIR
ncbi:hypothetical protein [Yersinia enterocolitica]|uniref:hypothetical protein n=1 Tax=Yersinia enterocolitica TaxID=630 RepID=UPI00398C9BC9